MALYSIRSILRPRVVIDFPGELTVPPHGGRVEFGFEEVVASHLLVGHEARLQAGHADEENDPVSLEWQREAEQRDQREWDRTRNLQAKMALSMVLKQARGGGGCGDVLAVAASPQVRQLRLVP